MIVLEIDTIHKYMHIRYKMQSIISGTGTAIWSKTIFGPTGHHHLGNSLLKVLFCEGVQDHLRLCLDHLSCVKMAAFQFCLQSGKQRK
jgi:hypothetical protein